VILLLAVIGLAIALPLLVMVVAWVPALLGRPIRLSAVETAAASAFAALLARQADYMIVGLFPGREEARKLGLIDRIEFLPKELVSAAMYVAFSKQSKCGALRTGVSAGIRTAVDGGAMRQLLEAADRSLGQ